MNWGVWFLWQPLGHYQILFTTIRSIYCEIFERILLLYIFVYFTVTSNNLCNYELGLIQFYGQLYILVVQIQGVVKFITFVLFSSVIHIIMFREKGFWLYHYNSIIIHVVYFINRNHIYLKQLRNILCRVQIQL